MPSFSKTWLLVSGLLAAGVILASTVFLLTRATPSPTERTDKPLQETRMTGSERENLPRLRPQKISQNGIYRLSPVPQYAEDLARQYSFIRTAMTPPDSPDGSPFVINIDFPEVLQVSDLRLEGKGLSLFALFMDSPLWCRGGACALAVYVARKGEDYQRLLSVNSRIENIFISVDEGSISILTCERSRYTRWQLDDGALGRPLPLDAPGYFIPAANFTAQGLPPCGQ